jgi:hypothetical protein
VDNGNWIEDMTEAALDAFLGYVESGQAAQEWEAACEQARWRLARLGDPSSEDAFADQLDRFERGAP